MGLDEAQHRIGVDAPVLTQGPADGLADEEVGVRRPARAVTEQPVGIGVCAVPQLVLEGRWGIRERIERVPWRSKVPAMYSTA